MSNLVYEGDLDVVTFTTHVLKQLMHNILGMLRFRVQLVGQHFTIPDPKSGIVY
jgi:hypothetical protein